MTKLLAAFLLPTVVLFGLFSFFVYKWNERDLDIALGSRLVDVARTSATSLKGQYLEQLSKGDEDDLRYTSSLAKIQRIKKDAQLEKVYVFNRRFESIANTSSNAIGEKIYKAELDRSEIKDVFASGLPVASMLFEGLDGAWHKTGYAPVFRGNERKEVVAVLGVDAPANYFKQLNLLKRRLLFYGLVLISLVSIIAVAFASRLTRPLSLLANESEKIGRGDLRRPIDIKGKDEIGRLATTMESMRVGLAARDERSQMMLAGIAHEVRNPLGGIELYTGILRDELHGDDEKLGFVGKIDREVQYLKKVVDGFLDYAKETKNVLAPVDLQIMVSDLMDLVKKNAKDLGVDLAFKGGATWVNVDQERFRRAVLNLIQNALQAAKGEPPSVAIELSAHGSSVTLDVINSGDKIEEKVLENMFDPFFTTKEKGTGLGLAFVKDIVDEHEADLMVVDPPGGGVCFRLTLAKYNGKQP